jgi:sterol desaturase/sphingolipid hydroxylase (fatty acid hydroxylase superfamily)
MYWEYYDKLFSKYYLHYTEGLCYRILVTSFWVLFLHNPEGLCLGTIVKGYSLMRMDGFLNHKNL